MNGEDSPYMVELEGLVARLGSMGSRKVLIQSPLGLRGEAVRISQLLSGLGVASYISSSNCWGGCDIAYSEAERLGVDTIIHLGHTPFMRRDRVRTIYLECRHTDPKPLESLIPQILDVLDDAKSVGLAASIQWLDHLGTISSALERRGVKALISKPYMFSQYVGQVLGCDYSSLLPLESWVDCYIIVGSIFHALGAALLTRKMTVAVDPHSQAVKNLGEMRERVLRQRYAYITAFRKARKVGVVSSVKPGQARFGLADLLARLLRSKGFEAYLITADEVGPETLDDFRLDGYVNTACPRLSLEDQARMGKPFLLPMETLVALNLLEWGYVVENGVLMYPWGWSPAGGRIFWKILRGEEPSTGKDMRSQEISCA
ncbi:hypothetical protein HRbin01_01270 [archaeon HR01]|nr:hypothetical protein HRbin01_01270 [archaeon HR01]